MKDTGRVALARIVIANREHIMAIEPWGKGLLGTTLRYDYEVRDEKEAFKGISCPRVPKERSSSLRISSTRRAGISIGEVQGQVRAGIAQAREAQGGGQDDRADRTSGRPLERHRPDGRPPTELGTRRRQGEAGESEEQDPQARWAQSQLNTPTGFCRTTACERHAPR